MKKGNYVIVIILSCLCSALVSNWVINPSKANAAARQKSRVVKATRFELVDSNGKTRATLGFEDEEKTTVLSLLGAEGKQTVELKSSQEANGLLMKIENNIVLAIAAQPDGGSAVMLNNPEGKPGVYMNGGGKGGLIMIHDKDGDGKPIIAK